MASSDEANWEAEVSSEVTFVAATTPQGYLPAGDDASNWMLHWQHAQSSSLLN